jgi:hypothetical protein
MITLRFNFVESKADNGQPIYKLIDHKPFPANILPAMLIFLSQEVVKLEGVPEDNEYKVAARNLLSALVK